jgi:PAS domain S-box-containing protein
MNFTLNTEQLNQIFPYCLVFDENFSLTSCSNKIAEFTGPVNDRDFADIFLIKNTDPNDPSQSITSKLIKSAFTLQLKANPEILFYGKLEYFGANQSIFYGDLQRSVPYLNNKPTAFKGSVGELDRSAIDQLIIDEKRYRDLYLHSPALLYTHTLDGKLLSCNPAAQNILGYSEEDIIGVNIENFLPAFDRRHFQTDYLDKVINEGGGKGIFRILPKNADQILYLYYQNYKVEESDSTSYIIGFSQDITDRVKIEKELRFAKLTSENLSKQKEFFLANMSHEIRTPINGILGLNNLLLKTKLDEKQEHYVKLSSESINSLLILINDILDIEKIGFGKIGFESHPFNISHKVIRTIQLFQHKAKEAGLEIFFHDNISKDLVVRGDQYRFSQILSNLLSNAIKFTKVGSINVTVNMVQDLDDRVKIAFSIKDTGIGVSETNLSEIFKPFVQASLSTTRNYGGTGLGLSICKKLIEMQGGHIKVYSKLGEGTEFVFTLTYEKNSDYPLVENQPVAFDPSKLKGIRVLVGEDVELNQFLIKNILESWGCEIDMVDNGIKIIRQLEENDYDIILMDIQMPEMDGLVAAKYIRNMQNPAKANIPIVAFTAGAMKGDIQKYKSVKMNDFILKPYSEKHLYDKLISVLNLAGNSAGKNNTEIAEQEAPPAKAIYDLSAIKVLSKNDDVLFNKVLNILISMLSSERENIQSLAKKNSWKEVGEIVHKIKTSLVHIHVDSLTQVIKDLEHYEDHSNEKLTLLADELCNSLENILIYLKIDMATLMNEKKVTI